VYLPFTDHEKITIMFTCIWDWCFFGSTRPGDSVYPKPKTQNPKPMVFTKRVCHRSTVASNSGGKPMGSSQLSMSNASKLHACRLFYVSLGYPMVTRSHTIRVTPTWEGNYVTMFQSTWNGKHPSFDFNLTSTPILLIKGGIKLPILVWNCFCFILFMCL
jgi:hypothetical protein